jgi:hypothetical protein
MGNSPHTASVDILDNDSLLHVFYLYRPLFLSGHEKDDTSLVGGKDGGGWARARWWYKLAHVCQRWRSLILGFASYLDLCLVCTNGTPVADMLAHSPPLPLIIDYTHQRRTVTTEDEEAAVLALKLRDRVRRIHFNMPALILRKLIAAMDEEYPILEYLVITHPAKDYSTILTFPETLQAPHLRHVVLEGFAFQIGFRLLTPGVSLVTLCLFMDRPSTYFYPNTLLRWLSFMPQLETLEIGFSFPVTNRDVERQLMHTPITTPVTLPNLRFFDFHGVSTYVDELVRRITAPRLEKLEIGFFNQLTYSVPHLLQFMNTTENLRFDSVKFMLFSTVIYVEVYPPAQTEMYSLYISVGCQHLDWQVSSLAQICNSLRQMFSAVEHLTLERKVGWPPEEHSEVDRIEWRNLLTSFSNVKMLTFRVQDRLVKELSRSLQLDDGELPLELLPRLQELRYSGSSHTGDSFASFVDARQNAGRPVTLVHL